ncbi:prepilin-type N-terminal cleavage/methylation domain-containing protein [Aeromonas veronii]
MNARGMTLLEVMVALLLCQPHPQQVAR